MAHDQKVDAATAAQSVAQTDAGHSQQEQAPGEELALGEEQVREAEAHRGFVREMDKTLGKAYGTGGAVVLTVVIAVVVVGAMMGWLTRVTLWVPGMTGALATLYLVRRQIYARRDELRRRVEKYCEINGLSVEMLRHYYEAQQMYPFFEALFEQTPRQLAEQQRALEQR